MELLIPRVSPPNRLIEINQSSKVEIKWSFYLLILVDEWIIMFSTAILDQRRSQSVISMLIFRELPRNVNDTVSLKNPHKNVWVAKYVQNVSSNTTKGTTNYIQHHLTVFNGLIIVEKSAAIMKESFVAYSHRNPFKLLS